MGLELQTNEQLKMEMRGLSVQFGYGAFGSELTAKTTGTAKCAIPAGSTDDGTASDTFVPFSHNDAYTLLRAFLDKLTSLIDTLFEICSDAESESTRIAAIKTIDTVNRRMIELIQSLGLATTISDERQINALVEGSSVTDRRAIIAELIRDDEGFSRIPIAIHVAERAGDTEEVDRLCAEFDRRVREEPRKKIRDEVLQVRTTLLTEANTVA
jgi:hypothetical protein